MVNKNNFVKLGLIRTFTMTNFAILLRLVCVCVCVTSCMCVTSLHDLPSLFLPVCMIEQFTLWVHICWGVFGEAVEPTLCQHALHLWVIFFPIRYVCKSDRCDSTALSTQHTTAIHNESTRLQ